VLHIRVSCGTSEEEEGGQQVSCVRTTIVVGALLFEE